MKYSNKDIQLFNEAGINIEDKNYTSKEVEILKMKVTDFIMSQSTKDINKYNQNGCSWSGTSFLICMKLF